MEMMVMMEIQVLQDLQVKILLLRVHQDLQDKMEMMVKMEHLELLQL